MMFSKLPKSAQTLLFSATIPDWIRNITRKYVFQPQFIDLVGEKHTPDKVTHHHIEISTPEQRMAAIASILEQQEQNAKTIIFVDTKLECSDIAGHQLLSSNFTFLKYLSKI